MRDPDAKLTTPISGRARKALHQLIRSKAVGRSDNQLRDIWTAIKSMPREPREYMVVYEVLVSTETFFFSTLECAELYAKDQIDKLPTYCEVVISEILVAKIDADLIVRLLNTEGGYEKRTRVVKTFQGLWIRPEATT